MRSVDHSVGFERMSAKRILIQQNNAGPNSSIGTRQRFPRLGWEMHTSYNPIHPPSDGHLFQYMVNDLVD